ncbi:MAG TPA: hypothetical protein VMB21_16610 [Candidatus Limnocylindria bacterium]|nr:hypothetical protein [Candidatus Limnocylindria bacterium]
MAILTGNIIEIADNLPAVCGITVEPLGPAVIASGRIVRASRKFFRTLATGAFSLVLAGGDYRVTFAGGTSFTVNAPDDEATYGFIDRITSSYINATTVDPDDSPLATTTVAGRVKLDVAMAPPVVVTLTTLNAQVAALRTLLLQCIVPVGSLQALANVDFTAVGQALLANENFGNLVQVWTWNAIDARDDDGGLNIFRPQAVADDEAGRWVRLYTLAS